MEKFDITGVPETMIQTLYARAKESKKSNPLIYDKKSIELVERIDYDFSVADKDIMMSAGVIARTILLDNMIKEFINSNPNSTVINLACGLDTRFYRVDNKKIRWYNLDLPEVIQIRKRFFTENDRVSMISSSAMEESWVTHVGTPKAPVLVVVEGLTMYLTEADVKMILSIITKHFVNTTIFMEIMSPMVVRKVEEKSIKASNAKFTWGIKSGKNLEHLVAGIKFIEDRSLMEAMPQIHPIYKVLGKIPFIYNLSNKITVLNTIL